MVDTRTDRLQRRPDVIATTDVGEAADVSERPRGDQPAPANAGQAAVRARRARCPLPSERRSITIRQIAAAGEAAWWIGRPIADRHGRSIGIVVMAGKDTGSGLPGWLMITAGGLDAADVAAAPTCGSVLAGRRHQVSPRSRDGRVDATRRHRNDRRHHRCRRTQPHTRHQSHG
jgi:hypothetical protein